MIDLALTPAESIRLVARRIAQIMPLRRPERAPGVPALAVVIGGQPGAAKSTIQYRVQAALGEDTAASYEADDDPDVHPRYQAATRDGGMEAHGEVVRSLPPDLSERCLDSLLTADPPYDVVTSAWLEAAERAEQTLAPFRDAGHRVVVVYVATNEADSMLAIADRYQRAKDAAGSGRWVDPRTHDAVYPRVPDAAHAVETLGYADDVYVVDRAGNVLYENHRRADGALERDPGVREAIIAERNRPPTPDEQRHFVETARSLRQRDDLEPAVDDLVRAAMRAQVDRPAVQPAAEPDSSTRLDARLAALRHVTGAGIAPPGGTSAGDGSRRTDKGRRPPGQQLDR
ncbi:zeta toxin family protein [Kribbella sp. NPDC026611]|uniref:zeta toxin family protein n=1 Tax=Kribbella sp. NPDC026611 TaxID=3154911 RepID=UPI0033F99699